ncbi:MAG: AmmeMemoRadiSam system protein B [Candidatus Aminicenantes bacterium]|nr:AmmeMemoRadiSam system protein B [Candidatus Aminicenantes bacterium]
MKRKSAVAGYFYPKDPERLRKEIRGYIQPEKQKKSVCAVISPHAGIIYSGSVAGAVYSSVEMPDVFIILGPNHRTSRTGMAIMKTGSWENPLGIVPIDESVAEEILKENSKVQEDISAHEHEHSIEVQLPFLQVLKEHFSIVPITISYFVSYEELEDLGDTLARVVRRDDRKIIIVASTDMSHMVSQDIAEEKDFLAIEKILKLDAKGLYDVVKKKNISMCGFQPTTSAIIAAKKMKAEKAELIKYSTSGDVSGDYSQVVGYAGIRIY